MPTRLTEGPLGFPMPDRAAQALDATLRTLPATGDHAYRHALLTRSPTELNPGERSDVSWISTEDQYIFLYEMISWITFPSTSVRRWSRPL
jgi:hypothetical protein